MARASTRSASAVTVATTWMKQHVAERGGHVDEVIPLGADTSIFHASDTRSIANRLVHVGNINRVKDQAMLLRAFRLVLDSNPEATLDIAGLDTLDGQMQSLATTLGIDRARPFPRLPAIASTCIDAGRRVSSHLVFAPRCRSCCGARGRSVRRSHGRDVRGSCRRSLRAGPSSGSGRRRPPAGTTGRASHLAAVRRAATPRGGAECTGMGTGPRLRAHVDQLRSALPQADRQSLKRLGRVGGRATAMQHESRAIEQPLHPLRLRVSRVRLAATNPRIARSPGSDRSRRSTGLRRGR